MDIVKKWAGCVMAFVAGLLGLVLSATSGLRLSSLAGTKSTKAYKVITDSALMDEAKLMGLKSEFVMLKVFAIITLIVSVLLLVYAVVTLLQNLNVIKSTHVAFNIAGYVLVALLLVAVIALSVATINYGSEVAKIVGGGVVKVTAKLGVYQISMLVVSIVTAIVTAVSAFLKRKRA